MAYTKEKLLGLLKELEIDYAQYEHPVVMTVEAQAKYVGNMGGGLSKNLFLKDKKSRLYVVSALADTKVDLKVLSQRLGLGKGGIRMAPQETLIEILKVPLGCVTPFALVNESSRNVSLLLDQGFTTQDRCFFHPLSNDTSIALNTRGLDKFLKSIGRDSIYVDLEANPPVGKDQPPDLAAFVPSGSTEMPDTPEKTASVKVANEVQTLVDKRSAISTAKVTKASSNAKIVERETSTVHHPNLFSDTGVFVEEILNKTSALLVSEMSQITEDSIKQHGAQIGTTLSDNLKKHLSSELTNIATMFKNTAYTLGFEAGRQHHELKRL